MSPARPKLVSAAWDRVPWPLYITANVVTFVIRFLIFNYLIFAGRARSIRFAREP